MPIEGLSNVVRIPRLGKIKLGIKQKNTAGVEYPVKTEYFVLPKDHPQYKDLVDLFGEKPKELHILIPTENEERWCSQYYRCYSKSRGLVCKGDGKTASRMVAKGTNDLAWKDAKEVEMKTIECPGKNCEIYIKHNCNEIMNLQFMIPEIPGLGVWQINTTSINSIININSAAWTIREIYKRLTNIPLLLTLEPQEGRTPDDGKKTTFYVLNLRSGIKLADLAIAARQQQEQFALPVSDTEAPDEDELGYSPNFDPIPPNSHTPEEDIKDLWPDGNEPEVKSTRKLTKTTKPATEVVPPLTDADFVSPVSEQEPPPPDPSTIEGTPEWIIKVTTDLKVDDAKLVDHIFKTYGTPIEEGLVINTVKQMAPDQRSDFTRQLKLKLAEKKVMAKAA